MSAAGAPTRKAIHVRTPCVKSRQVVGLCRDPMEVDGDCSTKIQQGGKRRRVVSNVRPPSVVSPTRNGVTLTKKDVAEMALCTSTARNCVTVPIAGNDVPMTKNNSLAITGDEARLTELRGKVQESSGAVPSVKTPKYNRELLHLWEPKVDPGHRDQIYSLFKTLRDITSAVKLEIAEVKCETEEHDRLVQELADSRGRENVLKEELMRESAEKLKLSQEAEEQKVHNNKLSREAEEQKVHYDSQVSRYKQIHDALKNEISGLKSENKDLERRIAACELRQRGADDLVARLQNEKEEMSKRAQREKAELKEKHAQVTGAMAQRHDEAMDKMQKTKEEIQVSLRKCEKQKRAMEMEQVEKEQLLQKTTKELQDGRREWEGEKRDLERRQVEKEQLLQKTKKEFQDGRREWEGQKRALEMQQVEKEQLVQKTKEELELSLEKFEQQKRAFEIEQVEKEQLLQKTTKELEVSLAECEEQKRAFEMQQVKMKQLLRKTKKELTYSVGEREEQKRAFDSIQRVEMEQLLQKTKKKLEFSVGESEEQKRAFKVQQVKMEQLLETTKKELEFSLGECEEQKRAFEIQQVEAEQLLQKTKKELESSLEESSRQCKEQKRALDIQEVKTEQLRRDNRSLNTKLKLYADAQKVSDEKRGYLCKLLEEKQNELKRAKQQQEIISQELEHAQRRSNRLEEEAILAARQQIDEEAEERLKQRLAIIQELIQDQATFLQTIDSAHEARVMSVLTQFPPHSRKEDLKQSISEFCERVVKAFRMVREEYLEEVKELLGATFLLHEKMAERKASRAKRLQDDLQEDEEEEERLMQKLAVLRGLIEDHARSQRAGDFSDSPVVMSTVAQIHPPCTSEEDSKQVIAEFYGKVEKEFREARNKFLEEIEELLRDAEYLEEEIAKRKKTEKKLQNERKTREKSFQDERKTRAKRLKDMVQLLRRLQSGKLDD